ncbi:nucleotide pyrophosphohydrolase [Mycoplasmatota bacterium]|nr:nucleotide pyrophosphohydrolase [Mycoplasmatota bacterium]
MKNIEELTQLLVKFRDDRDWKQFHTPENLSKSIMLEAAELLENFQWQCESDDLDNIKEEIADIFGYLLLLCNHYDLNLIEITKSKINQNSEKYPVDKSYGISTKYNRL